MSAAVVPLRPMKTAELLAREIVRGIAVAGLQAGDGLPAESEMIERYRVGRGSVREALRILEAQGLIYLKPGRHGGPVVARTGPEQLGRMLSLFMGLAGATYGDLADFMATVSPQLAGRAAANPDRATVREMLTTIAGNPCALRDNHEFGPHAAINRLSGNPLLAMFADAVDAVFSGHVYGLTQGGQDFTEHSIADHRAIADAVLDGREGDARALMAAHVARILDYAGHSLPGLFETPVEWR
jgi:GntR family transcriptional repressor for pyruvate dehydrogenase complex